LKERSVILSGIAAIDGLQVHSAFPHRADAIAAAALRVDGDIKQQSAWQIENVEILQEQPSKPHTMIGDNIVVGPGCSCQGSSKIAIGCGTKIGAHVTSRTGTKVRGGIHSSHDTQIHIGGGNHTGEGDIFEARVQ
jgi:hypothetical protein